MIRSHATAADAELFILTHELSLPIQGTLQLTSYGAATGPQSSVWLPNAFLKKVSPRILYSSMTRTTYSFDGGALTTLNPALAPAILT